MKIAEQFKGAVQGAMDTFKRFPLAISLCLIFTILAIYQVEYQYAARYPYEHRLTLNRLMAIAALGVPLSLTVALFMERMGLYESKKRVLIYGSTIGALIAYYVFLLPDFTYMVTVRYAILSATLYLTATLMTHLQGEHSYMIFTGKLIERFFLTILYALILWLGVVAIIFAVQSLLLTGLSSKIYLHAWLIVACFFSPIFFLYGWQSSNTELHENDFPKVPKLLLLYIIVPLVTAFAVVLILYFVNILFIQEWPKGIISYLVLIFSAASLASLGLTSAFKNNYTLIKIYDFTANKIVFLFLAMLFTAINMRIRQFGFTENRYFVVILGLWVLAVAVYFNVKKERNYRLLATSLVVVALLSVFGPLNAFSVSARSQSTRLYGLLEQNDMIAEDRIVPNANVSPDDQREIINILQYYNSYHDLKNLKYFPENFSPYGPEDVLGFSYHTAIRSKYVGYQQKPAFIADVRDYDYLVTVNDYYMLQNQGIKEGRFSLNTQDAILHIYADDQLVYQVDFKDLLLVLYEKYGEAREAAPEDLSFESTNEFGRFNLIIEHISGAYGDGYEDLDQFYSIQFKVLVKIK